MTLGYEPQRHRLLSIASMTSSLVGFERRANRAVAVMIIPGVQKPQPKAVCSTKAFWREERLSLVPNPSIVTICCPEDTCWTSTLQERRAMPSMSTEHAPHSPTPQPNFVPVRSRSSRRIQSRGSSGSVFTWRFLPLTFSVNQFFANSLSPGGSSNNPFSFYHKTSSQSIIYNVYL